MSYYGKKPNDRMCLTEAICLSYKDRNGKVKSGIVTIEIEFSLSDLSIKYLDVDYNDSEMLDLVETKPQILRNIDSYLRIKLLKVEYNI